MKQNTYFIAHTVFAVSLAVLTPGFSVSHAAPINYGDYSGVSVMYENITESVNTPGDSTPMYHSPRIYSNMLDFNPMGFSAVAGGGSTDITDGQLNFMLHSLAGTAISSFSIRERGDYTLFGSGSAATSILYAFSIGSISVLEVDGQALASPVALSAASASGGDNIANGNDAGSPWSLGLNYDVDAAMFAAGLSGNATRLDIALDNTLAAISEFSSIAMITKKDFTINAITSEFIPGRTGNNNGAVPGSPITSVSAVPVPAAVWLFASGLIGLIAVGRCRRDA